MALDSLDPLTAPMPAPPVRQFSFTDFQTNNPTAPPPGDRLDAEFDRANNAVSDTIAWANVTLNTDGTLRDGIVGESNLQPDLFDSVASDAIAQVQPLVNQAAAYSASAGSSSVSASSSATSAASQAVISQGAAGRANNAQVAAEAARDASQGYADDASVAATDASNAGNDAEGAAALAQDYADVTQAWAEHMPDPIPPNILAVMGITGDHWSSRWWANQAAAAFGALTSLYLGAFPTPPTQTPTGGAIPIGAIYYNTVSGQPYVWNGTAWVPFYAPTKAVTLSLAYSANGSQTAFPLTTVDLAGNTYSMNATTPEPIEVWLNGVRLLLNQPAGIGDWNVNAASSTVTLTAAPRAGSIVQIDVLTPTSQLAPSRVQTALLEDLPVDGVTTTFPLYLAGHTPLTVGSVAELFIAVDGAPQQPGRDYSVTPTSIVFNEAPLAGSRAWGLWYGPTGDGLLPSTGGTVTGPLYYTATGGTASRSAQDRAAESVNVKDFGAVGNGVTDDAGAINAALSYIRSTVLPTLTTFRLVFPPGRYVVKAPLNFTGFSAISGGVIDGQGSTILAQHTGIVIDALSSRWLKFRDLTVYGDQTTTPSIGIQVGRISAVAADYHSFYNVQVWGYYTFTAYYNHAAETCGHYTSAFRNSMTGTNRFCMVLDGLNHWAASSTFVTVTAATETVESFNENTFHSCTWQGAGSNGVVWMGAINRHRYISCYASCPTGWIFTVYQQAGAAPCAKQIDIDCHCELTGLQYAFMMTGVSGQTFGFIVDFAFSDHACQAATAVFGIDGTSSLTSFDLRHAKLRVLIGGAGTAPIFEAPAKWSVRAIDAALNAGLGATLPFVWQGPVENMSSPGLSFQTWYSWTTAARPTPAPRGTVGFATDTARFEFYDGTSWFSNVKLTGDTMTGILNATGFTVLNGAANAYLTLRASAGFNRGINFQTGTQVRWQALANSAGEGGSNAGSDFQLIRCNDSGAPIDTSILINRSTGLMTLAQALQVNGATKITPPLMTSTSFDAAQFITSTAQGSGTNGPATAQIGLNINHQKPNYLTTTNVGEIDGLYITARQGGPGSDCGGMLIDVAGAGTGFLAIDESVVTKQATTTGTTLQSIRTQEGAINPASGLHFGKLLQAAAGTLTSAILVNNVTSTGYWTNIIQNYRDGALNFFITDGGLVDASGGIYVRGSYLRVGSTAPISAAGGHIVWNRSAGNGEMDFINQKGGGSTGGFRFYECTTADVATVLLSLHSGGLFCVPDANFQGKIGFNNTAAIAKPTVSGSRGGNAALASLLTALATYGLVTDSTTA